jgi:hypothetical protein
MSPGVEERALTFAIHVIGRFGENTSTGSLGTLEEFVDVGDTKMDGVRPGALLCRRSSVGVCAGVARMMAPFSCTSWQRLSELRRRSINGRAVVSHSTASGTSG